MGDGTNGAGPGLPVPTQDNALVERIPIEVSDQGRERPSGRLDRAFRSTVGRESTTFGFSILVTVTFGVVSNEHGTARTNDLLLFATGAVLTGLNLVSVLIAVVVGLAMAKVITADAIAWLICPLWAGLVYLVLESLETALGERLLMKHDDATPTT